MHVGAFLTFSLLLRAMQPLRHAFFLPEPPETVELRAFTHGLMPRSVPAMMARFVEDWQHYGADAWNEVPNHWLPGSAERVGWWALPEYLGDRFVAPLLGAPEGTCVMQPNVHWTVQCLFSAPETFARRKEVLVTAAEFPSVLHSAHQWSKLLSLSLRVIPLGEDGFVDQQAVLKAINPATALVLLSHVGFTTGEKLPDAFLQEVAVKVHGVRGLLAIDGYHSVGSLPLDVLQLGSDLYFGGLLKEACGASGNAFVYIRPGLVLTPRLRGWFGDAEPFGFHSEPQPHPEVRRRFLGGTAAVASLYHAVEGVRLLLDSGLDAVRARSLEMTEYSLYRAEASSLKIRSPREAERRGALMVFEVPAADRLCSHLKQHHVYTDSRQQRYLRMAPFVWNSLDELERTFDLIAEAVSSGAYHAAERASPHGPVT